LTEQDGLSQLRLFTGTLAREGHEVALDVRILIDETGEIVFAFDPILLSDRTQFLLTTFHERGSRIRPLRFSGVAPDETRFSTDNFHFTRCGIASEESDVHLNVAGSCLFGVFHRTLDTPASRPLLRMHLRGFENFPCHETTSRLGTVGIVGSDSRANPDKLTGWIAISPTDTPKDFAAWRADAERLLEHVRRVMSFAASSLLRAPIIECYANGEVEIRVWSQTARISSGIRTIHHLQQNEIFLAAVASFENPPVAAKHFFFAIEWFAMESTYNEIRLVCAMTALENLLDANLDSSEALIQPKKEFKRTSSVLSVVMRICIRLWSHGNASEVSRDLAAKLADLNRRSFRWKLRTLASRWGVPLTGISENALRDAINARNRVVHRGQYYEGPEPDDADLWTHVTVIREVVVRFIFTIIGYRGKYASYLGDLHDADFPPT
jgi:hypothetical protein